jgi:radical SAM superfamily enzyme YgiQ (UPF0313 family)
LITMRFILAIAVKSFICETNMEELPGIYKTPGRQSITHLDMLPILDRSMIDYEKYNQFIGQSMVKDCMTLQATRGCPFRCAFCHKIWPKKHVTRSAQNLFDEIKLHYHIGIRRFVFVDDIFNFDIKNSSRFYELIIKNRLDVQLFFPNGLRCDLLSKDYIDLMVEAGTVDISFALDTASPRLQKLIGKNLHIEKFRENIEYVCKKYPSVILEFQVIHGFPTETEEEALMSLDFIKSLKWLDFPYIHILKIFPGTDMEALALQHGISRDAIALSLDLTFDELPHDDLPNPLPFKKNFTRMYQARFLHEYCLLKERLLHVLPYQVKLFTEDELMQKYNAFLPFEINSLDDLLQHVNITRDELEVDQCVEDERYYVPEINKRIREHFPPPAVDDHALRVLLLDLSLFFSAGRNVLYDVVEQPLGLMALMSYLKQQKVNKITGKIAKSRIDFDGFEELKTLLTTFKPDVIGIRTLTLFRRFFHETVAVIRQWGIDVPIIAGGPYATSEYQDMLQDRGIDAAVLGEGELTFCELVDRIMENNGKLPNPEVLKQVNGIAFILEEAAGKPGEIVGTKIRMQDGSIRDLSEGKRKELVRKWSENLEYED